MYRRHTNILHPHLPAASSARFYGRCSGFRPSAGGERGENVLWKVLEERAKSCSFVAGEIQLMYSCINNNLIWKSLTN